MAITTDENREEMAGTTLIQLDEDRELIDVMNTVLGDPNLHFDTRQRLAQEIKDLIRDAHEEVLHQPLPAPHRIPQPATPAEVTDLLTDMLEDPDLHTDFRFRLHREIAGSLGRLSSLPA